MTAALNASRFTSQQIDDLVASLDGLNLYPRRRCKNSVSGEEHIRRSRFRDYLISTPDSLGS